MLENQRKSKRRQIRYAAWIALKANDLQECVLSDVSDTGACIEVPSSDMVPDHFMLWLASNGSTRRACSVVWRQPQQVGVKFNGRFVQGEKASLPTRQ
jgi:hypothetical protein